MIGNGDVLFPHEIGAARERSACAGVMVARAALIKPWIFREATEGYWDITAEQRLELYRRYATLAREHWGDDAHGLERVRTFIKWHMGFWCRYIPRLQDGTYPSMQHRAAEVHTRSPLEALLARVDEAATDYVTDGLTTGREIDLERAPAPSHASGATNRDTAEVEG